MRRITKDAIFTLSHVHCPVEHAHKFETAAKWILPYCRINETANGQVFEHLHESLANPNAGTTFGRKHAYTPSRSGFSPRNATGRGEVIKEGTDVKEYMWFEEWRDWGGVEKHGETAYGKKFHSVLDEYIEEEWTFYQAPYHDLPEGFDPNRRHTLPSGQIFFNNAEPCTRGPLEVVHAKTDTRSRKALVDAFAKSQEEDSPHSPACRYMILLENRFSANEFVVLAELKRGTTLPPPGAGTSPQEWKPTRSENFVLKIDSIADWSHLRFYSALWPEEWNKESTSAPFPLED